MATTTSNSIHSAHALVRLLKSSTDPPATPGPFKIEIAHRAWSDASFRAPNKAEVIGEWILTLLAQAKKTRRQGDTSSSDPIADLRYWTLLRDVLTAPPTTAVRPVKTWLLPLLNRLQLDTIVIELLAFRSSQVLAPARAALAILWPLAEKKITVDSLVECLATVFRACIEWERVEEDLGWICSVVLSTYGNALANAGNKKKLYNCFLNTHLSPWLCAICAHPPLSRPFAKQLQDGIYAAGTDTLFSLDALKQPLGTLFDALSLSASLVSSLLPVLPRVFASFLSATHRHRSALFVSATSTLGGKEEIKKRGMEFVGRCLSLIRGSTSPEEDFQIEKWRSVIGLFEMIEKERLFLASEPRGRADATNPEYSGEVILNGPRDRTVEILETADPSPKGYRAEQVVLSIQLLGVLVRIEYNFVGSVLERILSALINIPSPLSPLITQSSSEFLTHVLEYHTKTRTVHTYALALLGAVAVKSTSSTSLPINRFFPLAFHLPALARALRTSLTPNQTTPLATAVLQAVDNAWRIFKDADRGEGRATKRRKVTEDTSKSGHGTRSVPIQCRAFSYTCRIAGTILSNLPKNAYTSDGEYTSKALWGDVGKLGWAVTSDCLRRETGKDVEYDAAKERDGKKRKHPVETGPSSALYSHIVTAAALRFLYDVRARVSFPLGDCDHLRGTSVAALSNVALDEASDSELALEIIRTLLWHMWYAHNCESEYQLETQPIFTLILDIIAKRPLSASKWSGVPAALTRDNLGLAVLHVLTDRWIDILDASASTESLERFISLLLHASLDIQDEDVHWQQDHVMTLRHVLSNLFRNAQFWELHHIRAVFLPSVLTLTAPLSSYHFPSPVFESSSPTTAAQTELTRACDVYKLLLYVPPEYLTRPVRAELVKRAMAGDAQTFTVLERVDKQRNETKRMDGVNAGRRMRSPVEESDGIPAQELQNWFRRLTHVRVFLHRTGQFLNTSNNSTSVAFVSHLLSPPSWVSSPSEALTNVTLDLIHLHILSLLRSQEPEAVASVCHVISTIVASRPFSRPNSQETWAHVIVQSSILRLVERLINDFDPASLQDRVKGALNTLSESLESALLPHAQNEVARDAVELDQFHWSEWTKAWTCTLSLTRWLGLNSRVASMPLGLKLATSAIRHENAAVLDAESGPSVLELLFEELWCMIDVPRRAHLDILLGFYVVNGGEQGSDIGRVMDARVARCSKKLPVPDFYHLLDAVVEAIGGSGLRVGQRERLIRIGKVMLHDAPQGTLKVIQNFATRCLDLFADQGEIYGGSSQLKMHCLEFIARYCSDRPAAIRSINLGSIWSLVHKTLSGSSEHDGATEFPIFQHIVTIVGALVRLRRDVVVHTLPHLSLVLCQLMSLIRKIRPQLGAKQSKIVTDTFPSWLSASQPLSTDDVRALARLLTSLTVKTIPRTHAAMSTTEPQKAASLAKPFAKHASYVLVAYVDAFSDPLCIVDAETRQALEPGLFALCEMVGEHNRDALMLSALDSSGKAIMKSLWREYEKQRYVGKG